MYDYQLASGVRPEEFPHVMAQQQAQGWQPEQIFQRTRLREDDSYHASDHEVIYDIVFRKASKDISYGQMLVNRAYGKLKEVADTLEQVNTHPAIVKDIREFLFQGSPDDM